MQLRPEDANWLYVPAAMALIAILPLPYGYYTALRPIMWIGAGIVAWSLYLPKKQMSPLIWAFLGLVLVYNPIIPLHLNRWLWLPINFLSAVLFARTAYFKISKTENK